MTVTENLCVSQKVFVHHRQLVSVTNSVCPSKIVSVCHKQDVSVTQSLCLSKGVCLCHTQSLSVTDSLGPSQKSLYVNLYLYQALFLIILDLRFNKVG